MGFPGQVAEQSLLRSSAVEGGVGGQEAAGREQQVESWKGREGHAGGSERSEQLSPSREERRQPGWTRAEP